jgi:hypothetical protein
MKRFYFLLLLVLLGISGCEKDDFCIDPITPDLVVRFYDADNPTLTLAVTDLTIWPEGRDTIVLNQTLDSVALPLNVNDVQTVYNFQMGDVIDQVTVDYTVDEIFVSRSCGFKANFSDLLASAISNNWIQSINQIATVIEDESAAHIQILH